MVQIAISWRRQLQCSEANVVQGFIVDAVCLVCVFNQLVDRKSRVVGLDDGVRDLKNIYSQATSKQRENISNSENINVFTLGDGTTEYVFMILSGYSSLILEIRRVPIPEPVPPPRE